MRDVIFINRKSIVSLIGVCFTGVSLIYIAIVISRMEFDWSAFFQEEQNIWVLVCLVLASLGQYIIVSYNWKIILQFTANKKLIFAPVFNIYSRANLAKYLPGNVMHFVGRNLLGKQMEISQLDIAFSTIIEIFLTFISAFILAILLSFRNLLELGLIIFNNENYRLAALAIIFIMLIFICLFFCVFRKKRDIMIKYKRFWTIEFLKIAVKVILIYMGTFLILGIINVVIINVILNVQLPSSFYLPTLSLTVLSWLAGYVVPGAPGGIGIREAVLIMLLTPMYNAEIVAVSAVLLRIVNILGDIFLFLINIFYQKCLLGLRGIK